MAGCSSITALPESIGDLCKLNKLDLSWLYKLKEFARIDWTAERVA